MNDRMLQPREGQAGEFAPMGAIALEELGERTASASLAVTLG